MLTEQEPPQERIGPEDDFIIVKEDHGQAGLIFEFDEVPVEGFAGASARLNLNGKVEVRIMQYPNAKFDAEVNYEDQNPMPESVLVTTIFKLNGAEEVKACDEARETENGRIIVCNTGRGGNHDDEVPVTLFLRPGHDQVDNPWHHATVNVVGIQEYPFWLQKGIDIGAGGILGFTLLGLFALSARSVQHKMNERRISKQGVQLLADLNNTHFSFTREGDGSFESMKRKLRAQPRRRRDLLNQALVSKKTLADITLAQVEALRRETELHARQEYDPKQLQEFITAFNNQNTEKLITNGLEGLAQERDAVGAGLLAELDRLINDHVLRGYDKAESKIALDKKIISEPGIYNLLLALYKSNEGSWFRREVVKYHDPDNQDSRSLRYPTLQDRNLRGLLIAHAAAVGKLEELWGSELIDVIETRTPEGQETMWLADAKAFINTIEIV